MKKIIHFFFATFILTANSLLFSSCIKDTCSNTKHYTWFEPLYKTTQQVRDNIKSNAPMDIQSPGKILLLGKYIFINEINKGIHIIDNSNAASPQNVAFINIPGNVDIAAKGNILYADLYTDLVTIDISDVAHIAVKNYLDNVFPQRFYDGFSPDSTKIIYDWKRHDTTYTVNCSSTLIYPLTTAPGVFFENAAGASIPSPVGITGSLSRFALMNNYLYTVDYSNLNSIDITDPVKPAIGNSSLVDFHVETIYPFKNNLFVGSNSGMYVYDVTTNPALPQKLGDFTHARSCDPVIADDSFAYVTLHSGTDCLGYNNEMDIVKLNSLTNAELYKTYNFTSPQGISKDGSLLFLCDGTDGLKVFDASDPGNLQMIQRIDIKNATEVIAWNKTAIVVAQDGLYQYDYTDVKNIHLLSKMMINN